MAYYYNENPGEEMASYNGNYAPEKHNHVCSKCRVKWSHVSYMCRNLGKPLEVNGIELKEIDMLCNSCLK